MVNVTPAMRSEHQDLGTFHPAEPLSLGDTEIPVNGQLVYRDGTFQV
jgi:hypothetical protein